MKKNEKQMEVALPFACAVVVFGTALYYNPMVASAIGIISLVGVGAYYYFMK